MQATAREAVEPDQDLNPYVNHEEDATEEAGTAPINVIEWILHEHTLFGLCFAKASSPNIEVPCCGNCCCVCADALKPRHRIWIFFFVLIITIFVSVQVTLGVHGSMWQFAVTTFVLMPATCFMKSCITKVSEAMNVSVGRYFSMPAFPCRPYKIGAEDMALLLLTIAIIIYLIQEAGDDADSALFLAVKSWALQMLLEIPSLFWKYFYCRFCCCCCCCWQDAQGDVRGFEELRPHPLDREDPDPDSHNHAHLHQHAR